MKISIEQKEFVNFVKEFESENSKYKGMRFGQAFFSHFKLYKMSSHQINDKIYNAEKKLAMSYIKDVFNIH